MRALLLIALALSFFSCDSCLPESWRSTVPPFVTGAIARHQSCVQDNPCYFTPQCHLDSEAYCLDAGYPATCGNAEVEGSCGINVK